MASHDSQEIPKKIPPLLVVLLAISLVVVLFVNMGMEEFIVFVSMCVRDRFCASAGMKIWSGCFFVSMSTGRFPRIGRVEKVSKASRLKLASREEVRLLGGSVNRGANRLWLGCSCTTIMHQLILGVERCAPWSND